MASYAPPATLPPWRLRKSRQRCARRSNAAMLDSVRLRSHASARQSAPSAPRRKAGGRRQRPAWRTVTPTAAATVSGHLGQPATPKKTPTATGSQYGAQAQPLLAVR
eukprot:7618301-Alexandrium_andersonii.AAC.1